MDVNYREAVYYLEEIGKYGSNYGLERMEVMMKILGHPEKQLRVIHIAGTNGKGSAAAMLSAVLLAAGYSVGVYTSPHLVEVTERIKINDKEISKSDFAVLISELRGIIEEKRSQFEQGVTQFELLTMAAILQFYRQGVDFAIFEVGLGGRLDATNILYPLIGLIMPISLEHREVLGNDLTAIAGEKAGIIKRGMKVVIAPQEPEALEVLLCRCEEVSAEYFTVEKGMWKTLASSIAGQEILLTVGRKTLKVRLKLLGTYQGLNAAVVYGGILKLRELGFAIEDSAVLQGFAAASWPGRFEVAKKEPLILLDGAHNPHGAQQLSASLQEYFPEGKVVFILCVMKDKEVDKILLPLLSQGKVFYATDIEYERALPKEELAAHIGEMGGISRTVEFKEIPLLIAKDGTIDKIFCFCGSLYFVGEVKRMLQKEFRHF